MVWAFADVVKVATKRKKSPAQIELRRARDCKDAGPSGSLPFDSAQGIPSAVEG
jgi:hypothetical protein